MSFLFYSLGGLIIRVLCTSMGKRSVVFFDEYFSKKSQMYLMSLWASVLGNMQDDIYLKTFWVSCETQSEGASFHPALLEIGISK